MYLYGRGGTSEGFFVGLVWFFFPFFPGGDPPTVPLKATDKMRERLSLACKNTA